MIMKLQRPVKWLRDKDRRFTQGYGENFKFYNPSNPRDPRNGKMMYWGIVKARPYHIGLDYAWPVPWSIIPCYSVEDWVVIFAWWDDWFGNMVKVSWASWISYYCHLSKISVVNGSTIKTNTEIWLIGATWNTAGVHLHFGWKPADKSLRKFSDWGDPTLYIVDRQTINIITPQPIVTNPVVSSEAQNAVTKWIRNGDRPHDPATREEVAIMVWRGINQA